MRRYFESNKERNKKKILYLLWEQTLIRHEKKIWCHEIKMLCCFKNVEKMLTLFMRSSFCFEVRCEHDDNLVAKSCDWFFWNLDNAINSVNSVIWFWN